MTQVCRYLLCKYTAIGLVRMNILTVNEIAQHRDIPLCREHSDLAEIWVEKHNPHLTENGELYIGDLDELVKRQHA